MTRTSNPMNPNRGKTRAPSYIETLLTDATAAVARRGSPFTQEAIANEIKKTVPTATQGYVSSWAKRHRDLWDAAREFYNRTRVDMREQYRAGNVEHRIAEPDDPEMHITVGASVHTVNNSGDNDR